MGDMLAAGAGMEHREPNRELSLLTPLFSSFLPLPTVGWVVERLFLPLGHGQGRSRLERTQKAMAAAQKGAQDLLECSSTVRRRMPRL